MTNLDLKQQTYPDLSDIFAAKRQRRLALAALSWEEKIAIVKQMQTALPQAAWGRQLDKRDAAVNVDDKVAPRQNHITA